MANDKDWQRRTDEWIDATNESRRRKEQHLAAKSAEEDKAKEQSRNEKVKIEKK